jgi:hypothetical protein
MPFSDCAFHGDAQYRQQRVRGADTGQVRGAARRGNDHFDAARFGLAYIFRGFGGRAVRRKHAALVWNVKFGERLIGLAHDFPVRFAAHDDGDNHGTVSTMAIFYCPWASE